MSFDWDSNSYSTNISLIEQKIATTREMIEAAREGRKRQRQAYENDLNPQRFKLKRMQHDFWARIEKGNELSLYQRIMKEMYSQQKQQQHHDHIFPSPTTLRRQVLFLFVSHQIEILVRSTALLERIREKMRQYMLCELSVMEEETFELKHDFMEVKKGQRREWDNVEAPLKHRVKVQQLAISRIRSAIKMQQEIRSHSVILNGYSSSSFRRHDLRESLSLVSSTFQDSYRKLEIEASPTTQRENLAIQFKLFLEIDGTFPGAPEDDEFFKNSMAEMLQIDALWD